MAFPKHSVCLALFLGRQLCLTMNISSFEHVRVGRFTKLAYFRRFGPPHVVPAGQSVTR